MNFLQLGKIVRALGYSLAGFAVLMKTRSARQETLFAAFGMLIFALISARLAEYLTFIAVFLLVLCAEAVNTAIELNADKISPEQSDYARDTKDLGSFAVLCVLLVWLGYFVWVVAKNIS